MKNRVIQSGITTLLTLLTVLLVHGTAGVASGATFYSDNFDNVSSGADPSPQVGTWVAGGANAGNGLATPPSSPNYLDSNAANANQVGYVGTLAGAPLAPGTPVHVEMQIYAGGGYPVIGISGDATNINPQDTTSPAGIITLYGLPDGSGIAAENSFNVGQATSIPYSLNTWEKWPIDYVVGADSFTLTVGANSGNFGTTHMKDPAATGLGAVYFKGYTGDTHFLVDNLLVVDVPEQTFAVSRGRQVLLDRGLQLQAWVITEDIWGDLPAEPAFSDANQFLDANFTTVTFYHSPQTGPKDDFQAQVGDRPWQWGRIYQPGISGDLTAGELAHLDNFVSMSYSDELPQTQENLDAEKAAFARWKTLYPNALAFTNFGGEQLEANGLRNYMQYTRPDVLMFDRYPGFSFSTTERNRWYSAMQLYRSVALEGYDGTGKEPLPYAQFLDLYRTTANGPLPSESFVRLQQFASWAFGFTMTSAFVYNKPPTSDNSIWAVMFSGAGDGSPTVVYDYVAESNRQSLNLGPALVRLVSTDIRMIPGSGKSVSGTGVSAWNAGANGGDNYITAIIPTLTAGGLPDTSYNDILIGYFKPLLDDNSDYPFADGTHFMIVNGAAAGTAAASAQWYRITFDFGDSGITALERLSRETGLVERIALTQLGGSLYALDLNLPGGTGDLFRYAPLVPGDFDGDGDVDGADFVAWQTHFPTASGATLADGDADGDGDVDGADFVVWQTNFPFTPGGANSPVPEPGSMILISLGGIIALARSRLRK